MKYLVHGMHHEAYLQFLKTKTAEPIPPTWNTTYVQNMYFYCADETEPEECYDENNEPISTSVHESIDQALGNASISAAMHHSQSSTLDVMIIAVPDDELDSLIDMTYMAPENSYQIPIERIENGQYEMFVYQAENAYIPSAAILYLPGISMQCLNQKLLSEDELALLNALTRQDDNYTMLLYDKLCDSADTVYKAFCQNR